MIAPFSSPIFLVGYMGSGKTSIGKALAERLDLPFLDLDTIFVGRLGCTISWFFETRGEAAFRELETRILTETLSEPAIQVVAGGGGVVLKPENRLLLKEKTICCFVDPSFETLWKRLGVETFLRPLLRGKSKEETRQHWAGRHHLYQEVARVTSTSDLSPVEVAEQLASGLLAGKT